MLFFQQSENLYTCVRDGKKIKVEPEALKEQDFVVFGMKACDVRGVEVLDKVFLADPVDSFYAARREHGTIVAFACSEPEETCFCKAFGIDAAEPAGDVSVWQTGDTLFWQPNTDKGEALTEAVKSLLEEVGGEDAECVEKEKASIRAVVDKLPYSDLSLDGWNGDALKENLILLSGRSFINRVLHVEPVLLYVLHASATTLRIMIQVMGYRDTAAGIPVCIRILP